MVEGGGGGDLSFIHLDRTTYHFIAVATIETITATTTTAGGLDGE